MLNQYNEAGGRPWATATPAAAANATVATVATDAANTALAAMERAGEDIKVDVEVGLAPGTIAMLVAVILLVVGVVGYCCICK